MEIFPVLNTIFKQIIGESPYKSPTDMGVNMAGYAIVDDEAACEASVQEIIRRYYSAKEDFVKGKGKEDTVKKIEMIMSKADIDKTRRSCVNVALDKANNEELPVVALELPDGRIVTGKTSSLLGACSAALLNAVKALANINDDIPLISPNIIEPIQKLKVNTLGNKNPRLHTDELLIALSMCTTTNPLSQLAIEQLPKLKGAQAHSSVIISHVDMSTFRKLGIQLTCEPIYETQKLYHR